MISIDGLEVDGVVSRRSRGIGYGETHVREIFELLEDNPYTQDYYLEDADGYLISHPRWQPGRYEAVFDGSGVCEACWVDDECVLTVAQCRSLSRIGVLRHPNRGV